MGISASFPHVMVGRHDPALVTGRFRHSFSCIIISLSHTADRREVFYKQCKNRHIFLSA